MDPLNAQQQMGFIDKETFDAIIAKLPPVEAEALMLHRKHLLESAKRASIAGILARNLSHNIGRHSSF